MDFQYFHCVVKYVRCLGRTLEEIVFFFFYTYILYAMSKKKKKLYNKYDFWLTRQSTTLITRY